MQKQLRINFSDEKLNLDYLSFNLPSFRPHMLEVAEIFYNKNFLHSLTFTLETDSWNKNNLSIHFKSTNSRRIYFLIKENIFSPPNYKLLQEIEIYQ